MARLLSVLSAPGAGIMRPGVLYAFLALAAFAATGCVAQHPKGEHGPSCERIESATHIIEHPIQRLTILKQVAHTPKLTQHEQTYLVNAIFQGGFGSDQADALVALLRNPCCTPDTREEIRKKLKSPVLRMLGKDERRILAVLDNPNSQEQPRGEAPKPATAHPTSRPAK